MDFTQRLPSEVFLAIFKSLSLVLKGCNSFAIDNHVWYHLALIRWEGKQGMADIHSEHHEMWFKKTGIWKKVYGIVEQEARRSKLNTDDLAETTWYFKVNKSKKQTNMSNTEEENKSIAFEIEFKENRMLSSEFMSAMKMYTHVSKN